MMFGGEAQPQIASQPKTEVLAKPVAPSFMEGIRRIKNSIISRTFIANEAGSSIDIRDVERVPDVVVNDRSWVHLLSRAVHRRQDTPTVPEQSIGTRTVIVSSQQSEASGVNSIISRLGELRPLESTPQPNITMKEIGNGALSLLKRMAGEITGANRNLTEIEPVMRGIEAENLTLKIPAQADMVLSEILLGKSSVQSTIEYSVDSRTGLILNASMRVQSTIAELDERIKKLNQSPRLIDQKQARVFELLRKRIGPDESEKKEWEEEKREREQTVQLQYDGIKSLEKEDGGLAEYRFSGNLKDPKIYYQEKEALRLAGLNNPSEVNAHQKSPDEPYDTVIKRLAAQRAPVLIADRYSLRKPDETDTQLLLRLTREARKTGSSMADTIETLHSNEVVAARKKKEDDLNKMPVERYARIIREKLTPLDAGGKGMSLSGVIERMVEELPSVGLKNAAIALLREIESGGINSDKKGALKINVSVDDLEKLVGLSKGPVSPNAPQYEVPYVPIAFAGIFGDGDSDYLVDAAANLDLTRVDDVYNFISNNYNRLSKAQKYQIAVLIPVDMNIAIRTRLAAEGKPL